MAKLKLVQDDEQLLKFSYSGARMGKGYMTFLGALIVFPGLVSIFNSYDLKFFSYLFTAIGFGFVGLGIMQIAGNLILVSDKIEKTFTYNKDYVFINFGDTIPFSEIKKFTFRKLNQKKWEFTVTGDYGEVSVFKSNQREELLLISTQLKDAIDPSIQFEMDEK